MAAKDNPKKQKKKDASLKAPHNDKLEVSEFRIEHERLNFRSLLLSNPNYFGNLELSEYQPVKAMHGNTKYEEMICVGLNPPYDRLEAIIHIKQASGYSGNICSEGSYEYVRFYVDIFDTGAWHDVGVSRLKVHNIPGDKPLSYAVMRDFDAFKKFCRFENIVQVRAILEWNKEPPPNQPGYNPVWGNVLNAQVQIHPKKSLSFGDFIAEFDKQEIQFADDINALIKQIDPKINLAAIDTVPLTLTDKRQIYAEKGIPVHRFAFQEVQYLLEKPDPNFVVEAGKSALIELGLDSSELDGLIDKFTIPTDGDTSFEELQCVGLYPEKDLIEAVLTVKKSSGYSGNLCGRGSLEYVGFWMDFDDGSGFHHIGTATVNVHDLDNIPDEDLQYAVFLKTNLSEYRQLCSKGAKIARLRAILSWEKAPTHPNYIPTWGNRVESLVQLHPLKGLASTPLIETVGDIAVDDINLATGLGDGPLQIGAGSVQDSPFGGYIDITGRIGNPPDSFGGGVKPFKYRIRVFGPPPFNTWHPLTNPITVKVSKWNNGIPEECSPGSGVYICNETLVPTDDGDGYGPGWYDYLEDIKGPKTRFLVVDKLARWSTNRAMEGDWWIQLSVKDTSSATPQVVNAPKIVHVRVDNTAPSGPAGPGATQTQIDANPPLKITSATFNGIAIPALACGKFPVGTLITGTYEVHDPGTSDTSNQHFKSIHLAVHPAGPANNVSPTPASVSYPAVSTNGTTGTWKLDTKNMAACGYVIRLTATDRTNNNSRGNNLRMTYDVGFCLEDAPEG